MDISINGKPADIVPDTEKTLGEVLSGLSAWLSGSGHRLSGIVVNGKTIGSGGMDEAFDLDLSGISTLDLCTSSWPELAVEALIDTQNALESFQNVPFNDRGYIHTSWIESAAAQFLSGEMGELFALADQGFRGEGPEGTELTAVFDERLREISDPRGEFGGVETLVTTVATRLEELPLDVQTGKDGRAAETVQLFSHIAEKIFRLFYLLKLEGLQAEGLMIENLPVNDFIEEFSTALKELLAAYEVKDAVLVGDLAEYELAPRLRKFYGAIKEAGAIQLFTERS